MHKITFKDLMLALRNKVNSLKKLQKCIIFGTGKFAKDAYYLFNQSNIDVCFFIDNDTARHGYFMGKPVYGLEELTTSDLPIVVCSTWMVEILEQIQNSRYKGKVYVIDPFLSVFDDFDLSDKTLQEINFFYESLDKESKEIFYGIISLRVGDYDSLKLSNYDQYFHPEFKFNGSDVFIDGGAYIGDTVESFERRKIGIKAFHCFEPDFSNFKKLSQFSGINEVHKINSGLWSESGKLRFSSSNESAPYGCKIQVDGDEITVVISIDEYCELHAVKPTVIKLDIEGSEYHAIVGASETIKNEKPKLAICVYHKYYDIWILHNLIKSIRPDYKFFLGHHTKHYLETILYAV